MVKPQKFWSWPGGFDHLNFLSREWKGTQRWAFSTVNHSKPMFQTCSLLPFQFISFQTQAIHDSAPPNEHAASNIWKTTTEGLGDLQAEFAMTASGVALWWIDIHKIIGFLRGGDPRGGGGLGSFGELRLEWEPSPLTYQQLPTLRCSTNPTS